MPNPAVECRPAVAGELPLLDDLAFRAKAHWGYPASQMEAWRAELRLAPAWIARQWVQVAVQDGQIVGCFAIVHASQGWRLEHLWVEPDAMGQGVGRALLGAACMLAHGCGATALTVDADPHAAAFYLACGGVPVGTLPAPIDGEPARVLPVFQLPCAMPRPGVLIRTLAAGEWPLYRETRLRSLADAPDAFCSTLASETALDHAVWAARTFAAASSGRDLPLLAEVDGAAGGLLWAKIYPEEPLIVNLFQVWVAPQCRGRGVAAALLGQAIAWARTKHAQRVQLSVTCGDTPAVRLYLRLGFEQAGAPQMRANTALMEQQMHLVLGNSAPL
jgi:GNAT superfamily N-acetyltransferase